MLDQYAENLSIEFDWIQGKNLTHSIFVYSY